MSTTAQITAATAATVKELTKAGIKVRAYAKNPISGGNATFSIALDQQNELRIWNGEAKVTVVPSTERGLRQVVLKVHEKGRTITKVHKLQWADWDRSGEGIKRFRERQASEWWITRRLGVTLPPGAEYSVKDLNRIDAPVHNPSPAKEPDYGTVTLQGRIKTTNQNFLIGRDEKSQFISALPRQASSVTDAHDALRPKGVPRGALRQGEWFFVPATAAERKAIDTSVKARGSKGILVHNPWQDNIARSRVGELERDSSHHAPCSIIIKGWTYACGLVYDTRPDRHGSLMLSGWHKVIRNREVTTSATQNIARFD